MLSHPESKTKSQRIEKRKLEDQINIWNLKNRSLKEKDREKQVGGVCVWRGIRETTQIQPPDRRASLNSSRTHPAWRMKSRHTQHTQHTQHTPVRIILKYKKARDKEGPETFQRNDSRHQKATHKSPWRTALDFYSHSVGRREHWPAPSKLWGKLNVKLEFYIQLN